MSHPVDARAQALVSGLRPSAARRVIRALVREGEDAALLRLRGALAGRDAGDLADEAWREALFDALERLVSPEPGDDDSGSDSAETVIADHHSL